MDADAAELQTGRFDAAHYKASSLRENLLERLFVVELLRTLWCRGAHDIEILKPEVEGGGYDLVLDCNGALRHVQLKSSRRVPDTADVSVNSKLAERSSGCVLWILFDRDTLELGPFLWFGGEPGEKLPPLGDRIACHSKGLGLNETPNPWIVAKAEFEVLPTMDDVIRRLFGTLRQTGNGTGETQGSGQGRLLL